MSSSVAHVCAGGHGSGSSLAVSRLRSGLNWREVTSRRSRSVPSSHGEWLAHRCPSAQLWLSPHEGHISVLHRGVHGVAPGTRRRGLSPPGRLGQVLQEAAILTLRAGVRGREILRTSFGRRMPGELTWCTLRVATREERLEDPPQRREHHRSKRHRHHRPKPSIRSRLYREIEPVLSQRKANRSPNQCVYYSDGILREMGGDDLVSQ